MNIKIHKSQIKTLKSNDPRFYVRDSLMVTPRAGFEINEKCPREYRMIIAECINNGWLTPIANVSEKELVFIGLTNEH